MKKEEKIIATAYTGKMFIESSDMGLLYEYMEKKVGYKVFDLILADKGFWEKLHKACEQDFIDMVSKEQPSLPTNLDEAAKEIAYSVCGQLPNVEEKDNIVYYAILAAKAGAEWMAGQNDKDLSEKIAAAYQLGLADKEKQMMSNAVEGSITAAVGALGYNIAAFRFDDNHKYTILLPHKEGRKYGDKVRIIIVEEEK